eukprot:UN1197
MACKLVFERWVWGYFSGGRAKVMKFGETRFGDRYGSAGDARLARQQPEGVWLAAQDEHDLQRVADHAAAAEREEREGQEGGQEGQEGQQGRAGVHGHGRAQLRFDHHRLPPPQGRQRQARRTRRTSTCRSPWSWTRATPLRPSSPPWPWTCTTPRRTRMTRKIRRT